MLFRHWPALRGRAEGRLFHGKAMPSPSLNHTSNYKWDEQRNARMRIALSLLLGLAACAAGASGIYFYGGQTLQLPTATLAGEQPTASVPASTAPTPVKTETILPEKNVADARAEQAATPQVTSPNAEVQAKRHKKKQAHKNRSTKPSAPKTNPQATSQSARPPA